MYPLFITYRPIPCDPVPLLAGLNFGLQMTHWNALLSFNPSHVGHLFFILFLRRLLAFGFARHGYLPNSSSSLTGFLLLRQALLVAADPAKCLSTWKLAWNPAP